MLQTIYSKASDEELNRLHGEMTEKYGKDLQDEAVPAEERKLEKLAAGKAGVSGQREEILRVRDFVKEYLYRNLHELALLIYLTMRKRNDFGVMGEQRISVSFCRNLCGVPNDRVVSQLDADRLSLKMEECDRRNGNKSGDEYLAYIKNYSLEFFGTKYPLTHFRDLSNLLEIFDNSFYFFNTNDEVFGVRFAFGAMEIQKAGPYEIYVLSQEYIRSPQLVLSIAAEVFRKTTIFRQEACEVVFFNKWQKFFDKTEEEKIRVLYHPNSLFRDGVKMKALSLYNAADTKAVLRVKDAFLQEMKDGVVWHEMGHHASHADMDPVHHAFLATFVGDSGSLGSVLFEALADWAPEKDGKKGAFARFMELSRTDRTRAARDIYVYLSDNWFVDEEEEFLSLQSDVSAALALSFLNSDGSVAFERMENEIEGVYAFFVERFRSLADKLLQNIRGSRYMISVEELDFAGIEKMLYEMYQKSRNARPLEELRESTFFWHNVLGHLQTHSKDGWERFQNTAKEESSLIKRMILSEIIKDDTMKYNNSLREYVMARALETGIIKEAQGFAVSGMLRAACAAARLPDSALEQVKARFLDILNGDVYDAYADDGREADPFIAVAQELMLVSGDMKSSMLFGRNYNPRASESERERYIKRELKNVYSYIQQGLYSEIDTLRLNQKYSRVRPIIKDLLTNDYSLSRCGLREKIKVVEYALLDGDVLMEVCVPLKRGCMDWNTSQAVLKVNSCLRPDDMKRQFIVDKEFLEFLLARCDIYDFWCSDSFP